MKISVVIPAYNEEKLIGKCLDAINRQTLSKKDYELIVVDNNSTDKTAAIAKKKGARVVSYTKKKGAIWAKQFAITQAKADIIAVTDADAIPDREWLENILMLMENKKVMCVGGTVHATGKNRFAIGLLVFFDGFARMNQYVGIPFIWGSNMAFRRKAFKAVGGFNTRLKTSDDWEFTMRIQKKYGLRSAVYTNKLKVKASPRKQEKLDALIPYVAIGFLNFITIFIMRKSVTFGSHKAIR